MSGSGPGSRHVTSDPDMNSESSDFRPIHWGGGGSAEPGRLLSTHHVRQDVSYTMKRDGFLQTEQPEGNPCFYSWFWFWFCLVQFVTRKSSLREAWRPDGKSSLENRRRSEGTPFLFVLLGIIFLWWTPGDLWPLQVDEELQSLLWGLSIMALCQSGKLQSSERINFHRTVWFTEFNKQNGVKTQNFTEISA